MQLLEFFKWTRVGIVFVLLGSLLSLGANEARALGKARPSAGNPATQPVSKKILSLDNIPSVTIDLPRSAVNGPAFYDFGPNLRSSLIDELDSSGRYIPIEFQAQSANAKSKALSPATSVDVSDRWDGNDLIPAGTLNFYVDALVFRTGGKGDAMYYGFDERFRNPYNDGSGKLTDEFPLSLIQFQPNHFYNTFDDRGSAPFDSFSGLDLGEGFQLNALVAWVDAKWASYHSEIRMRVELDSPLSGRHEIKTIAVTGHGFFFDIVGGYQMFSGGIGLARKDAMTAAFKKAFAGSFSIIDSWMKDLRLTAKVFGYVNAQKIYLNTGANSNIPVGTRYECPTMPHLTVEVTEAVPSGSIAMLSSGNLSDLTVGMVLREVKPGNPVGNPPGIPIPTPAAKNSAFQNSLALNSSPSVVLASEVVDLPKTNLPKSDFTGISGLQVDFGQAFLKSIIGFPFLPYRIWRYFSYDQSYQGTSDQIAADQGNAIADDSTVDDSTPIPNSDPESAQKDQAGGSVSAGAMDWSKSQQSEAWAKQIGLTSTSISNDAFTSAPVVAVIDTGMDYNHSVLRDSVWVNPSPFMDPLSHTDSIGWDFISGDSRPFDDNYHGTEIASAVLAIAPQVRIMPLKVFNPWGITSSAAMYGAFQYAVDHGAQIILCAWATGRETQTIESAVQYARDHGVLVIAAAGDRGDDISKNQAFPAVLSKKFDNVLTVTGVDTQDQLVRVSGRYANFDPETVQIAAPGLNIKVADPREHTAHATTTGVAAAIVAGAVSRNLASAASSHQASGTYHDWIRLVLSQADTIPSLTTAVHGGLRLHLR